MKRIKHSGIKNTPGGVAFDVFNYAFMLLFCITILFPFWDNIVISFSKASDISYTRLNLWPKEWCLESYKYCLQDSQLIVAFRNSILRTIIGTIYHLIVCSLAAFSLTRNEMPFRKLFTMLFLITMFFSGGLIPTYLNIRSLGLTDNFLVYILPGGFSMYNTIVIRNYFMAIDKSLEESATIDGASMLQVMIHVIIPLSVPVLATVGMWQMVGQWNSWFDNMIYARDKELMTLQYMLHTLLNNAGQRETDMVSAAMAASTVTETGALYTSRTVIAASTLITVAPVLCVYPFLQRYFVKGIMLGAVKG